MNCLTANKYAYVIQYCNYIIYYYACIYVVLYNVYIMAKAWYVTVLYILQCHATDTCYINVTLFW